MKVKMTLEVSRKDWEDYFGGSMEDGASQEDIETLFLQDIRDDIWDYLSEANIVITNTKE